MGIEVVGSVSSTPQISEWPVEEIMTGRCVKSSCKGLERADGVIAGGLAMPGAAVVGLDYFSGLLESFGACIPGL